ncbi:hypothetical protein TNCT_454181 [Trichonephila clavata]|uniref:Uncharacterized protein n=1 Tax=Trichonephila clavata TaxID=2740835 RepID=A0A8X6I2E2_TRICU|nr:hypothetical protein TNCT_454181 [Trichonephila clavata]
MCLNRIVVTLCIAIARQNALCVTSLTIQYSQIITPKLDVGRCQPCNNILKNCAAVSLSFSTIVITTLVDNAKIERYINRPRTAPLTPLY